MSTIAGTSPVKFQTITAKDSVKKLDNVNKEPKVVDIKSDLVNVKGASKGFDASKISFAQEKEIANVNKIKNGSTKLALATGIAASASLLAVPVLSKFGVTGNIIGAANLLTKASAIATVGAATVAGGAALYNVATKLLPEADGKTTLEQIQSKSAKTAAYAGIASAVGVAATQILPKMGVAGLPIGAGKALMLGGAAVTGLAIATLATSSAFKVADNNMP